MLTWMVYVIAVSLLLGIAALAAERAARLLRTSTRWYWFAAFLASLLVPATIASVSIQLPEIGSTAVTQNILVLREVTSIPLSPQAWLGADAAQARQWMSLDPWFKGAWLMVSALMLLVLMVHGAQLYRRMRSWKPARIEGRQVLVAPDVGPAVVGFIRPRIVLPAWLTETARPHQAAVVAHEQSHLAAGDAQLFTVALCLLVFMPWNLPLWWQLKRLRNAIEVDCDARVLDAGQDVAIYGETLISVGARQSAFVGAVAAMSESRSFLEERIAIMMKKPTRWWPLPAAALAGLSLALVAAAAQVSPPNAAPFAVDSATLDLYTGTFKLRASTIATIARSGPQLSIQLNGQVAVPIYAASTTRFVNDDVRAEIDFVTTGGAPATALVLRQNGHTINAPRIDATTAQLLTDAETRRMQLNQRAPGGEEAIRDLIQKREAGQEPDYSKMTPRMAQEIRDIKPTGEANRKILGRMLTIQYQGAAQQGMDSYLVRFENGSAIYRVAMKEGILAAMSVQIL
jgi:bla regulator protein BlaR1